MVGVIHELFNRHICAFRGLQNVRDRPRLVDTKSNG